jgi:hypothetical protein
MAKKIPKASRLLPISSIPRADLSFWFSDNIEDWMFSHKNTMTKIRRRNEFAEHEQRVSDFKRKHG